MAQDAAKLLILQANLESLVGQLDAKTNEVTAATQEAATQKALVQQITKKLDVLSKRCKTLEQENTRMCEAQVGRVEAEVQTEPDAVLESLRAETAAVQESLRDAKTDWEAMAASLQAQAAQEAAGQLAALEVANEARRALEAQLHEANERAVSAASESAEQFAAEAARAREDRDRALREKNRVEVRLRETEDDEMVDRRLVCKLLVTYVQKGADEEILDLMSVILNFTPEQRRAVGARTVRDVARDNTIREGGMGGMLSFVSALTGIEGVSAEKAKAVEGKSFAEVWNTYLFEEEEESRAGAAVAGEAGAGASAVAAGR